MRCTLFPIYGFHFSHVGFLVFLEGFNEATLSMLQTHMVMASKGECYKSLSGWPITRAQPCGREAAKFPVGQGFTTFIFYVLVVFLFHIGLGFGYFLFYLSCNPYIKEPLLIINNNRRIVHSFTTCTYLFSFLCYFFQE